MPEPDQAPEQQRPSGASPYRDDEGRPRYGMLLPEGRDISEFIVPLDRADAVRGTHDAGRGSDAAARRPDPLDVAHASGDPHASGGRPPGRRPVDPHDTPAEQQRRLRRRRAIAGVIAGFLMLVLGPVAGAAVGVFGNVQGWGALLSEGVATTNGGTATLPEGQERQIYRADGRPLDQCSVTDPGGGAVPTTVVPTSNPGDAVIIVPGVLLTTTSAGDYTIDCAEVPAGTQLLVSPQVRVERPESAALWVIAGLVVGAIGLGLAIWGVLVLRYTRRPAWRR